VTRRFSSVASPVDAYPKEGPGNPLWAASLAPTEAKLSCLTHEPLSQRAEDLPGA
jgi:hypothetical protein